MNETFAKKEKEKKKAQEKRDKALKMKERKANSTGKTKSLDDMMAYLDENGNITSTPPDPTKRKEIELEDIQLGAAKVLAPEDLIRTGTVTFFNDDKGYGFIADAISRENVFVHANNLRQPVKEKDKVTFETERTQRGMSAINVKKIG